MKYGMIDQTGLVVGVTVWDGETEWQPPEGLTVVKVPDGQRCGSGWTFDGSTWTAPPRDPYDE